MGWLCQSQHIGARWFVIKHVLLNWYLLIVTVAQALCIYWCVLNQSSQIILILLQLKVLLR